MKNAKGFIAILFGAAILFSCGGGQEPAKQARSERDNFIDSLLQEMTLEEKIGQMTLFTSDWDVTGPTMRDNYKEDVVSGKTGAIFNAHTAAFTRELQRMAVEDSRLGIPLIFGYDVIHGHKTIFPIPLAEAASWDLATIEKSARFAAMEAAAGGLHWTFNPMVDIARDPRWGRIAEGSGEDVLLGSLIAQAKVKGYQGNNLADPLTVAACVKHFAAYGAGQAGRDYHFVDMVEAVAATGKPVIPVVMAGRPLTISWMAENMPAIVWAWHLGTMAGPAITDVLFGDYNPSGKLPVTFPRNVGQIPIHYDMKNTGRPFNAENKYTSKYLDVENTPLFAFGHGLSYSTFAYSNLRLNKSEFNMGDAIEVKVKVSNSSDRSGEETVQLYIRDMVGSVTRPVLQLKAFHKVKLAAGESRDVVFNLSTDDLRFYTRSMAFRAEPGDFKVFVGGSSAQTIEGSFVLTQ